MLVNLQMLPDFADGLHPRVVPVDDEPEFVRFHFAPRGILADHHGALVAVHAPELLQVFVQLLLSLGDRRVVLPHRFQDSIELPFLRDGLEGVHDDEGGGQHQFGGDLQH